MTETDIVDRITYFYLIFFISIIVAVFIILYYVALYIAPNIINVELPNLPIDYNSVYPILLQGLIITAGVILGLFGGLFFETSKKLASSIEKYKMGLIPKTLLYLVILTLGLAVILFALFSIFYSINAMINYGIVSTYITTQLNANIIHTISTSGNVVLINASYISNSITLNAIEPNYELLLTNSRLSITYLFDGFEILVIFIAIYVFFISETIDQIKKFIEEGLANFIVMALIIISIEFISLFLFNTHKSELYLGMILLIFAGIIFLFRKVLNQYFDKLAKKRRRGNEKQNTNLLPPPPSNLV
jgi:ABC-type multidrug transport system fused ATPase/permease subunit